jgi:predicted hotdog family 3-hydroxylacyl-ACP dehydratase
VLEQEGFGVFDCAVRNADEGELLMSGRLNFFQPGNKNNVMDL